MEGTKNLLDELRDFMQGAIDNIQKEFDDPNDDWEMVCLLRDASDRETIMPLHNALFANGATKDVLAEFIKWQITQQKSVRIALLLNMHMKEFPNKEELEDAQNERRRVSEMEGSREGLMLICADAEQEDAYTVEIFRDGVNPPTLGEWQKLEGTAFDGRFAGLNEAMRTVTNAEVS